MTQFSGPLVLVASISCVSGCVVGTSANNPNYSGDVYAIDYRADYKPGNPKWNNSYNSEYIYNSSNYGGNPTYNQAWYAPD